MKTDGTIDVIIIGAGPAGLSAAVELKRAGVSKVVVIEREPEAGGIPRHCGHSPFGMREFTRLLTGPRYAKKLVKAATDAGVDIRTSTSVVELRDSANLLVTSNSGVEEMSARRVILATGAREMPRSARLISGGRPKGVFNTGALQGLAYLENIQPFKRPLIIGTELVSFSSILTCRHIGIRPAAMIEHSNRVIARWPVGLLATLLGVPRHFNIDNITINGKKQVQSVEITDKSGGSTIIECDGVLLTGSFTPEASLARSGNFDIDPGSSGPVVDQYGRCSDPTYFATGNLLRPVETAGWCWNEGRQIARHVADDLAGNLTPPDRQLKITINDPRIKYAMPQKIALPIVPGSNAQIQLRLNDSVNGTLVAKDKHEKICWQRQLNTHPERRILVPVNDLIDGFAGDEIFLGIEGTTAPVRRCNALSG